jgi:hypothetical protein
MSASMRYLSSSIIRCVAFPAARVGGTFHHVILQSKHQLMTAGILTAGRSV